jgi:hypothetical protein
MIKLNENTFQIIAEGTHTFKVTKVDYDSDFGKLTVEMVTKDGLKNIERFSLINNNGETNEKAINAFSYLARMVMNNPELAGDFDEQELVNRYVTADVEHQKVPSTKDPNKTVIFYKLSNYAAASGFDKAPVNIDDF